MKARITIEYEFPWPEGLTLTELQASGAGRGSLDDRGEDVTGPSVGGREV
jgi:hypothetical protein